MTPRLRRSLRAYGFMMLTLVGIKALLVLLESTGAFRSPAQAAVFGWPFLLAYAVIGAGALWIVEQLDWPGTWDLAVPARNRFTWPVIVGLLLGLIAIGTDAITNGSRLAAAEMHLPSIHIDFPASLIIYPGGAVIVTIFYYLIPVPLLVWLTSKVLGTRRQEVAFLVVGALAAWIEPVTQDLGSSLPRLVVGAVMLNDYALNVAQVLTFRRAGLGAAVLVRVSYYMIWHVLWGLTGR